MEYRPCTRCKKNLSIDNFLPSAIKKQKDFTCKTCINIKQKEKYNKKLIEQREYRRLQYLKNKEVINEKRKNSDSYIRHLIKLKMKKQFGLDVNEFKISEKVFELQKITIKAERWVREHN